CGTEELSAKFFNDIPENVMDVDFTSSRFNRRILFPNHIKYIWISHDRTDEGTMLTLSKRCKEFIINCIPAIIVSSHNMVQIKTLPDSYFKSIVNECSNQIMLELRGVRID
ncbi:hypothetical protein VCUG_02732, partial [Vavraia culicis subsp. floridensis]